MFVTMLTLYFAVFGADVSGHRPALKSTRCLHWLLKCNKCTKKSKHGAFRVTPIICNSCIVPGKSRLVLVQFCGKGEKRLLVAKKRDPNQFQGARGAAGCNFRQYVRLLQSSIERAMDQSMGLASPQWKLVSLHWRCSSLLQMLHRLFLDVEHFSLPQAHLHVYAETILKPVSLHCTANGILDL